MKQDLPAPRNVFADAAFHFTPGDRAPHGCALTSSPGVRRGAPLSDEERAASAARGGDGAACDMNGGWITGEPAGGASGGSALSFCIRFQDRSGRGNAPLLSEYSRDNAPRFALSTALHDAAPVLLFELTTTQSRVPLAMEVPLALIGPARWHDVVGRFTGPHVALFVDGVLVDENWPIGTLQGVRGRLYIGARREKQALRAGFAGRVGHVAVWDRALTDGEIAALSGGPEAARDWELPAASLTGTMQYSRAPAGGSIGDCLPFFRDGVYHFYYLHDRRHHGSKWGLGAHQWAHSSSRDLVHWEHHPLAIPITEQWEGSICTGSVFHHEGTYYGFYASRREDRTEHLSLAVSTDGIHFTKCLPNPFASPQPPYRQGPFRDPTVFRDEATGLFHMLVTAELSNPQVEGRGGCLAHLVSTDLRSWEQREPFLVTGYGDQPECSELFSWNGWHYLLFSHYGFAHYRMSRSTLGPWTRPPVDVIDGPLARVMKTAAFTGDRRIGTFFLAEDGYAGRAVFRELVQNPDGTLGSRWPREMVPAMGEELRPGVELPCPGTSGDARHLRIEAREGFAAAALTGIPRNLHLRFSASVGPGCGGFGVGVRGNTGSCGAWSLLFEPSRRKVGWRKTDAPSWSENESAALYDVAGMDKPINVELIVMEDVLDACINGCRTLICRDALGDGDRLFFYCQDGSVEIDEIAVHPLGRAT